MAMDSAPNETKSRRAVLVGAAGGLAALIAGRFAAPDRASATAGDPLIIGSTANNAGTSNTALATASSGTAMLVTQNGSGTALRGSAVGAGSIAGFFTATNGTGISGVTAAGGSYGVFGQNNGPAGSAGAIRASGGQNHGLVASTASDGKYAVQAAGANGTAIYASAIQEGIQAHGYRAVHGMTSDSGVSAGVYGDNTGTFDTYGVYGRVTATSNGRAVFGDATGTSGTTYGVYGNASSINGLGVFGNNQAAGGGIGIEGDSLDATGVYGVSTNYIGVFASGPTFAGYFQGDLACSGTLSKGAGTFKIDHPLDPANKFLYHSFVESPDMKNVYDGIVALDKNGEASVALPAYFDALNRDPRYQLTAIGVAAPGLHVMEETTKNAFSIAGGTAGQKVSWQVTGIRQDAFAKAHPVVVEVAKTGADKGRYLHPVEHGKSPSKGITVSPNGKKR